LSAGRIADRDPGSFHWGFSMGIAIVDSTSARSGFKAGAAARGEFHCGGCGYGISVRRLLPTCPMCRGTEWHPSPGRPVLLHVETADLEA